MLPPPPTRSRPGPLDTLRWWLSYWIARPLIRREVRHAFEDGYAMGMRHGMQIEAEEPGKRRRERGPDATPEPHDLCTTEDANALQAGEPEGFRAPLFVINPDRAPNP
jgi:hypothetical protein